MFRRAINLFKNKPTTPEQRDIEIASKSLKQFISSFEAVKKELAANENALLSTTDINRKQQLENKINEIKEDLKKINPEKEIQTLSAQIEAAKMRISKLYAENVNTKFSLN